MDSAKGSGVVKLFLAFVPRMTFFFIGRTGAARSASRRPSGTCHFVFFCHLAC